MECTQLQGSPPPVQSTHKSRNRRRRRKRNSQNDEDDIQNTSGQKIFEIKSSRLLGRYLVAGADLEPGTLILEEDPLVVGPANSEFLCVICYTPVQLNHCKRCICGWPRCAKCPVRYTAYGHTQEECKFLKDIPIKPRNESDQHVYQVLTPLRTLLCKNQNAAAWDIVKRMEAHTESRSATEAWTSSDQFVIEFLKKNSDKNTECCEEEIHFICGCIQVNSFAIEKQNLCGLYPRAYLFAHDCTPNTSHIIDRQFHLRIRTTELVKKGDILTISYCNTLQGTVWRRNHLKESKYFNCSCKRCLDPTEFGTYFSAVNCSDCKSGYFLPWGSVEPASVWTCNRCKKSIPQSQLFSQISSILTIAEELKHQQDIKALENFLKCYKNLLHRNHFISVNIKYQLSQLYGKTVGYMINDLTEELLNRKMELCKEILLIFDVLEPGLSRIRGVTLYELHAPLFIMATKSFDKSRNKRRFNVQLKKVEDYLKEAQRILSFECPVSSEGQMCKAAEEGLKQMNLCRC